MQTYTEQTFNIPELKGISRNTLENHLKLYSGYVKNANLINEKIGEYMKDVEKHAYALGELVRRFSFEFNGMRNHEYYFRSLEGGPVPLADGPLKTAIEKDFADLISVKKTGDMADMDGFDIWLHIFKNIALIRGIGWAMLYYDPHTSRLTHAWVDEQHLGQLNGLHLILGLDMWEHSYMMDYTSADKKKYIEAFFENLNWDVIEKNFAKVASK